MVHLTDIHPHSHRLVAVRSEPCCRPEGSLNSARVRPHPASTDGGVRIPREPYRGIPREDGVRKERKHTWLETVRVRHVHAAHAQDQTAAQVQRTASLSSLVMPGDCCPCIMHPPIYLWGTRNASYTSAFSSYKINHARTLPRPRSPSDF